MIKRIIRKALKFSRRLKMGIGFILTNKAFLEQKTYGDISNKKSNFRIVREMFCHIMKYGEINKFYFAYGLDQKGSHCEEYMAYSEFMDERNKKNYTRPFDYLCILRDKNIFVLLHKHLMLLLPRTLQYCAMGNSHFNKKILTMSTFGREPIRFL